MIKGTLDLNVADVDAIVRAYVAEHLGMQLTGYTVTSHATDVLYVEGDRMTFPAVHSITKKNITIEGLKL